MNIILFFIFVFLILLCNKSKFIVQFCIIGISLYFSFRNDLVPDTAAYKDMFYGSIEYFSTHIEFGFLKYAEWFHALGFSFQQFLFVTCLIEMEIWYWVTRKLFPSYNIGILLVLCLCYYGIYFYGIVLRASIAISIGYLGFYFLLNSKYSYLRRYIIFFGLLLLAVSFHASAWLYVLCPFFLVCYKNRTKFVFIIAAIVFGALLTVSTLNSYMEFIIGNVEGMSRFSNYLTNSEEGTVYFGWFFSLIIVFLAIWSTLRENELKSNRIFNFFMNAYFVGFLSLSLTLHIPAGSRFGMMLTFFEFIVVYYLIYRWRIQSQNIRIICMFGYIIVRFAYLIHQVPLLLNY